METERKRWEKVGSEGKTDSGNGSWLRKRVVDGKWAGTGGDGKRVNEFRGVFMDMKRKRDGGRSEDARKRIGWEEGGGMDGRWTGREW